MWAPFFDVPCEQAPAAALSSGTSGSVASVAESKLPKTKISQEDLSADMLSQDSKPAAVSNAKETRQRQQDHAPKKTVQELRQGAVGVGVHAASIQVSGLRVKGGTGRCLANVAAVQDRAYWEVHVIEVGGELGSRLQVGMSAYHPAGSDALEQEMGTSTRSYGVQFGGGGEAPLREGDIIGVTYDQSVFPVSVSVWRNGSTVAAPLPRGLKGEQWPALFIGGCTVDWALGEEHWKSASTCPTGFSALMLSRGLIGD